jgi:Cu(I)/Ag(I) efflux system membrane fusion protein
VNRSLILSLAVAAVVAAIAGAYWAGTRHAADQRPPAASASSTPAAAPDSAAGSEQKQKILYYRNPMGLADTSPVPKKDSMGMDYIPVFADDAPSDAGVVKVSPARVQILGVQTAVADVQVLDAPVRAVGRVEVNERAIHEVSPKFEGWIERLYVNASGDPVRRGQPLFSVYSPELVSAQKEMSIADELKLDSPGADATARANAKRLAEAARERLQNWDVAPTPAGESPRRLTFTAPASGVVLEKKAVEGMRFTPGQAIYRIADLSTVWVIADVYEQDLARIKVGQKAMVEIDAFPGKSLDAKITYLYPTLNVPTRTTPIRLEISNRDGLLRPGMFAHVELATGGAVSRLTVPASAIIDTGERQVALLVLGEGKFKPQTVHVGLRGADRVEIVDGLKAGDRVVVSANFLIDAESNLKAALANFGAPTSADGGKTQKRYQAVGVLDGVNAAGVASISHEPIAELKWPAMSTDFALAAPDLAQGVKPGAKIRFEFEQRGPGEFVVTRIKAAGASAPPAGGNHGGH